MFPFRIGKCTPRSHVGNPWSRKQDFVLTSYKNTFNNLKQQAPNGTLFDWSEVTHIIHYFAKAIDISRGEAICD